MLFRRCRLGAAFAARVCGLGRFSAASLYAASKRIQAVHHIGWSPPSCSVHQYSAETERRQSLQLFTTNGAGALCDTPAPPPRSRRLLSSNETTAFIQWSPERSVPGLQILFAILPQSGDIP